MTKDNQFLDDVAKLLRKHGRENCIIVFQSADGTCKTQVSLKRGSQEQIGYQIIDSAFSTVMEAVLQTPAKWKREGFRDVGDEIYH